MYNKMGVRQRVTLVGLHHVRLVEISDVNKTFVKTKSLGLKTKTSIFFKTKLDFLIKTKARLFISRPRLYSDHCTGYDIMVTK